MNRENSINWGGQFWRHYAAGSAVALALLAAMPQQAATASTRTSPIAWASHWAWTEENWTGDNAAYDKLCAGFNAPAPNTTAFQALLDKYKLLAQKNPSDPLAQFGWGYLTYRLATKSDYTTGVQMLLAVNQALDSAPSPHAYQYARLRFLAENYSIPFRQTRALGKRLLGRKPEDTDVKYVLAGVLNDTGLPEERQLALKYAQELIHALSAKPRDNALLGSIYFKSWALYKHQEDADKAIAAYQQYLALAPGSDSFRSTAQRIIDNLKLNR